EPFAPAPDAVAAFPELRGDALVGGVLHHAAELAATDLPADLAAELEVLAHVVDGPGPVGGHVDPLVGGGDELLPARGAGEEVHVGHPDEGVVDPAVRPHRAVGAVLPGRSRRLPGGLEAREHPVPAEA